MEILGIHEGNCQMTGSGNTECAVVVFNPGDKPVLIGLKQLPNQIRLWHAMQAGVAQSDSEKAKSPAKTKAKAAPASDTEAAA